MHIFLDQMCGQCCAFPVHPAGGPLSESAGVPEEVAGSIERFLAGARRLAIRSLSLGHSVCQGSAGVCGSGGNGTEPMTKNNCDQNKFPSKQIKQATQTPRLMLRKVRAGWLLVTAVISMGIAALCSYHIMLTRASLSVSPLVGPAFTKPALSSLFTLWRMSFPRSVEECKTERGCGDAITWEATLEARAGALASMGALVECGGAELCTAEVTRRMTVPVETAVTIRREIHFSHLLRDQLIFQLGTMGMVGDLLLLHGVRIRPAIQLLHLRLFSLLEHLPVGRFESAVNPLLKELVAELTLSDNAQATQCTSLCASTCTSLKAQFLEGAWADAQYLEAQLNPAETVPAGAPDNDPVQALIVRGGDGHHEGTTDGWYVTHTILTLQFSFVSPI